MSDAITQQILVDGAMASTNTIYSTALKVKRKENLGLHAVWSGTPMGAFTFWASNIVSPSMADDTDWVQLSLSSAPSDPAGSASRWVTDFNDFPYLWLRVKYVNDSGSGTLQVYAVAKE